MDFEDAVGQHDDRVHLVPPGPRPRGRRHGRDDGSGRSREWSGASGSCSIPTSAAGLAASARSARPAQRGDYSICWQLPRGPALPGHPHRQCGRGHRRVRRSPSRALRRWRSPSPTDIDDEVAVLADPWSVVVPRHHPQPAGARSEGRRLRRRCARDRRRPHPAPVVPRRRGGDRRPLAGSGRPRPLLGATVFEPDPARGAGRGRSPPGRAPRCAARGTGSRSPTRATSTSSTTPSARRDQSRSAMRVLARAGHARAAGRQLARRASSGRRGTSRSCGSSGRTRSASRRSRASGATPSSTTSTSSLDGRIDLSGMLTHRFRLDEWRDAFTHDRPPGRDRRHQGRVRLPLVGGQSRK